jgi:hypothetical protein
MLYKKIDASSANSVTAALGNFKVFFSLILVKICFLPHPLIAPSAIQCGGFIVH